MQSLSQILRQMPLGPDTRDLEKKQQQLLSHPLVKEWKKQYPGLEDGDLSLYMNRLYQFVREQENCAACPGLSRCPNDFPGHSTKLAAERAGDTWHVLDSKAACPKWRAHQSREAVRKRIRSFYVDERALNQGYSINEIFEVDPERAKSAKQIMEYILKTKKQGLQKKGLYLAGELGTGKTFLMCYLLYELAKNGYTGVIVYMPDFIEDLKSMFQEPARMKETVELLKETDLLVFDDIGAENLSPWVRDHVLGTILNYRMNRKPTFFTSNYELDALEKHFSFTTREGDEEFKGRRLMDRIRPFVEVVMVKGENKRGKL